ncbi:hypothetical protein VPH35_025121 [Triticum aestivum]|uniref:mitochondrial metalloendopeptidase OMA1-like n=1 Tax=Triticum aestivum TaxID=4565 RepID=UPI000843E83D|nr:mitochondrial metalloendopeptidase OMA1-like [Triticum aestivum]
MGMMTMHRGYHVETVPYTNRAHLVPRSGRAARERHATDSYFAAFKKQYASWILKENDDQTVRVKRIVMELVGGVHRSLPNKARHWVDDLKWEAVVLRHDSVNAYVLCTGKIVVFTGLLRRLHTDAEIAAVLGHEFGHVLAKHTSEMIANLIDNKWFPALLTAPFLRWQEIEADYIGMMLLAAAGYDPHEAPRALEKVGKMERKSVLEKLLSSLSHPSCKKRSRLLSQPRVMRKAMTLYTQVKGKKDL